MIGVVILMFLTRSVRDCPDAVGVNLATRISGVNEVPKIQVSSGRSLRIYALDAFIADELDSPPRPEAIRRLVADHPAMQEYLGRRADDT